MPDDGAAVVLSRTSCTPAVSMGRSDDGHGRSSLGRWVGARGEAVAAHHSRDCCQVGRAAGRGVEDGCDLAEVAGTEDAGGDNRERLRAQHLGPRRFAQLRNLLLDLNQPTS